MDPGTRRRIRNRNLLLWAVVVGLTVVSSIPNGPPPSPGAIYYWLAGEALVALATLPLAFALSYAEYRLRVWRLKWKQLRLPSGPAPPGVSIPFHFHGRRWKASVGILAFVSIVIVPIWLLPLPGQPIPNALAVALRWLGLAFAALAVPAALLGVRLIAYEIDDRGVRVRRPVRRRSFDVSWDAIVQVEVPQLPAISSALYGYSAWRMKTYGLRTRDGDLAGIVRPFAELGAGVGGGFESALLQYSAQRGLKVVDVPWRATLTWKQRARSNQL